jgi:hypothetical protein
MYVDLTITSPPPFVSVEQTRISKINPGLRQPEEWYLVEGCIERAKETAGVRYELIKRAAGGVYPEKFDVDTAFRVETDADDNQRRLITVSAVFFAKSDALKYIASVDEYVNSNRD